MSERSSYRRVLGTFMRNSLIRDMSFRSNFLIECVSSMSWIVMNVGFYILIFEFTNSIGSATGWGMYEYFVFLSTTIFVNSIVQAFFMPNAQEFSELIRTGGLDFVLLKPMDPQFLVSFQRVSWSQLVNLFAGSLILTFSLWNLTTREIDPLVIKLYMVLLYPFYILCGVTILYSLMISLAATSIWLGRNQTLYNFWFYITNFSRYPMEIYQGSWLGSGLRISFTYVIPVLVVVNVPARILAQPLCARQPSAWYLAGFAVLAAVMSLAVSRWVFRRALGSYRSASS